MAAHESFIYDDQSVGLASYFVDQLVTGEREGGNDALLAEALAESPGGDRIMKGE